MKEKNRWTLLFILGIIFIVVTIFLLSGKIIVFDDKIYEFLIGYKSNLLTSYFKIITKFADTITILILCMISLLTLFLKKKDSLFLIGTVIISTIVNQALKHIFVRVRPVDINLINETGYSFPSGHAMASVTFYGFLIYLTLNSNVSSKLKWIINSLLTFLITNICLSRIYLGVHFASDVLSGILLSISLLLIITFLIKKYQGEKL